MFAGCAEHAQKHRKVDVRHMKEIREHVLGMNPLRVDFSRFECDLQRQPGRKPAPDGADQVGRLVGHVQKPRQDEIEQRYAMKCARHVAESPAQKDHGLHSLRALPIGLERNLTPHRMPHENALGVPHMTSHGAKVLGVRPDVDAVRVRRGRTATVPPIVPMGQRQRARQFRPKVLPDKAIAQDPVAQDRAYTRRRGPRRSGPHIETRPVRAERERFIIDGLL